MMGLAALLLLQHFVARHAQQIYLFFSGAIEEKASITVEKLAHAK